MTSRIVIIDEELGHRCSLPGCVNWHRMVPE